MRRWNARKGKGEEMHVFCIGRGRKGRLKRWDGRKGKGERETY